MLFFMNITSDQVQDFKTNFAKIPDESDSLIKEFLESSYNYVLRLSGQSSIPTVVTGQDDNGQDITDLNPDFKTAIFSRALYLHQERDFPRDGVMDSVDKYILNLIAGATDFSKRTVLTEPETED